MVLAEEVIARLRALGFALCTVESCTGGMIAQRITDISGASDVFWGSLVTYDNSAKMDLVRVPKETLARHGAVSTEVARAMALGGIAKMKEALSLPGANIQNRHAWIAVSTTGVAGPTGGTAERPVGLCFIAVAVDRRADVLELRLPPGFSRAQYREQFTEAALKFVLRKIEELSGQTGVG